MTNQKERYDLRYSSDYRQKISGFEVARWDALSHFIPNIAGIKGAPKLLDYGSGSGLYVPLWKKLLPDTELHCCDISSVALEKLSEKFPDLTNRCYLVDGYRAETGDEQFDAVISVEVMEHVEDVESYLRDVHRLLKPGGKFIWTTPCANPFSIEHIIYYLTGQIEQLDDGYRRWKSEADVHVRRFKSGEVKSLLYKNGFEDVNFRFRSHLFSYLGTRFPGKLKHLAEKMMTLDYRLFRRMPNGASMLGVAKIN
ncbi:methyltransferase domain-containing protein [bacterium]|nr:methyltransferase domain-containing protein [bacterium]MBU1024366.1 methyltransferase domain-containing protein [bacterium]